MNTELRFKRSAIIVKNLEDASQTLSLLQVTVTDADTDSVTDTDADTDSVTDADADTELD